MFFYIQPPGRHSRSPNPIQLHFGYGKQGNPRIDVFYSCGITGGIGVGFSL